MVRLEFTEGTSKKFWELALEGAGYKVRWGRIGTKGQEKAFSLANPGAAQTAADKLIAEKKRKGYQEVGKTVPKAKPAPPTSRDAGLEKLIAKRPDDPDSYLVYADWLSGKGDARGELINVQHALSVLSDADKKGARGKELAKRANAIIAKSDGFLPDVPPKMVHVTWRWGFLESVHFNNNDDWMKNDVDVVGIAKRVFATPVAFALSELRIGVMRWDYSSKDVPAILKAAAESPAGPQIRRIQIGAFGSYDVDCAMYNPGKLEALAKLFPGLESLKLHGSEFSLATFELPNLKTLAIETCGLTKKHLKCVLDAKWPKLERVELWFGSEEQSANCRVRDLGPILDGSAFPKVKHLGLMNAEFTDDLAQALVTSKVLKNLKTLDLSKGMMGSVGARAILEAPKAFKHLESLSVDDNYITKPDLAQLKKLGITIVSKEQKEDDDSIEGETYRYVSMGE
jgi:uncharacterized protein (TIGR02996 family)